MVLSSRLAAVAALVPSGARLADIGTDHACLPVSLLLEGRIDHAIAADVRKGPLDHARRTAEEYGVENQLDFRLCDGLAGIRADECDTITIAGMGGETIAGILSRAEWTREGKRLILQPQSTQEVLRDFLSRNGWKIFSESIVLVSCPAGRGRRNAVAQPWRSYGRPTGELVGTAGTGGLSALAAQADAASVGGHGALCASRGWAKKETAYGGGCVFRRPDCPIGGLKP